MTNLVIPNFLSPFFNFYCVFFQKELKTRVLLSNFHIIHFSPVFALFDILTQVGKITNTVFEKIS